MEHNTITIYMKSSSTSSAWDTCSVISPWSNQRRRKRIHATVSKEKGSFPNGVQGSKLTTNWSHTRLDFWLCA